MADRVARRVVLVFDVEMEDGDAQAVDPANFGQMWFEALQDDGFVQYKGYVLTLVASFLSDGAP